MCKTKKRVEEFSVIKIYGQLIIEVCSSISFHYTIHVKRFKKICNLQLHHYNIYFVNCKETLISTSLYGDSVTVTTYSLIKIELGSAKILKYRKPI